MSEPGLSSNRVSEAPFGAPGRLRTIRRADQPRSVPGVLLVFDIVDSTSLLRRLGDWAYLEVIEAFEKLVEGVQVRHGAVGSDHTGDGFILVFSGAAEALAAAADVFAGAARLEAGGDPHPLPLRAGMHQGDVILRRKRLVGLAVYEAHELGNGAGPDELWVSAAARQDLPLPALPERSVRLLSRSGVVEVTILRPDPGGWPGVSLAAAKAAHADSLA